MRRDVVRTSKHIHHIDGAADFGELAKDRFAEDLRDIGVVNGNGDDVVAGGRHMRGDVERGLIGVRLRLDAEDGDRLGVADRVDDSGDVVDQVASPLFRHSLSLVTEA